MQFLSEVRLPAEQHPEGVGMDTLEGLLYFLRGCGNGDVSCGAALLKDLHVVDCGVAVEFVLMTIKRRGEFVEVGIERIEPARTREAVPIPLSDDMGSGVDRGE